MTRYQKGILIMIGVILLTFISNIALSAYSQQARKRSALPKEETYTRPAPTKPIKPVIPTQNRYQNDKVFLENADSLYKIQAWNDTTEKQIVSGNVKFRQGSLWMFCDSAYYYPEINSMDAFGHVRMEQGDTLFVYADQLFYNGDVRLAKLTNGPSQSKVRLKDPSGELLTDTLDYDVDQEIGYYGCGGELHDDVNTLTSVFGQYNSRTKDAEFFYDVELINHKDDFSLLSDTLYYNTATHMARIDSPTDIYGPNDTIFTRNGWYNTELGNLEMTHRATIIHTDSLGRATVLEGDSIVYDNSTRISRAYQYRDLKKLGQPTVITDTANKIILISGFGMYNDSTKEAFATEYPLLKEYSRADTLYLRADTIFSCIRQDTIWTPKFNVLRHVWEPFTLADFRYIEVEYGSDDFMEPISEDEMRDLLAKMLAKLKEGWIEEKVEREVRTEARVGKVGNGTQPPGERNKELMTDSVAVPTDSLAMAADSISLTTDSLLSETDIISSERDSISIASDVIETALDSVMVSEEIFETAVDSIRIAEEGIEAAEGSIRLTEDRIEISGDSISFPENDLHAGRDSIAHEENPKRILPPVEMVIQEIRDYHVAKAYPRARFFNPDAQGVADTLEFYENDSLMYMKRKPVVWSGERQVTGKEIILHFNDSTVDHAFLPQTGFMAEHVDEDFYNQLAGKKMEAWLEDSYLKRLYVDGNVQVIMLPMENDSTYNKLVDAESSYMTVDMKDRQIEKIKMWPEVTGNTTPIFLVKKNQKYLPGFQWLDAIRPKRVMIDGVLRWDDELGEIPELLETYFNQ